MTSIVTITKALIRRRSDGQYLLLRRSAWDDRPDLAHQPDLPGGTLEPGEMLAASCQRELQEETGLVIPAARLRLVYMSTLYYQPDDNSVNRALYFVEVDDPSITLSWEHEAYEWCSLDDLGQRALPAHWLEAIGYARQHGLLG